MSANKIVRRYFDDRIETDLTLEQLCNLFRELDLHHGINRDEQKPAEMSNIVFLHEKKEAERT